MISMQKRSFSSWSSRIRQKHLERLGASARGRRPGAWDIQFSFSVEFYRRHDLRRHEGYLDRGLALRAHAVRWS